MTEPKPATRGELMRPAQLLGLAFVAAIFAGVVTAVSMGIFQAPTRAGWTAERAAEVHREVISSALTTSAIIAGATFIVVLLVVSMLLLAVKPQEFGGTMDKPVLLPDADDASAASPVDGERPKGTEAS